MPADLQLFADATVLLVEDQATVRRMIRRMLNPAAVVEANDGEHAIELVERDEARRSPGSSGSRQGS
jgi:CheY-like chemotaxis protein